MAEVVGAFYAVETVAEGAAAGALAVSGSTVPLHAKFQKIVSPTSAAATFDGTVKIVKNKIYVIGGETSSDVVHHGIHVLSLPPDFGSSRTESNQAIEADCELQKPQLTTEEQRPLQPFTGRRGSQTSVAIEHSHHSAWSRIGHSSVAIDDKVYVLGGLAESTLALRKSNTGNIIPLDIVLAYDTLRKSYSVVTADPAKSTESFPESRYSASCTASPYPTSISAPLGEGPTLEAHGTIFLHGGYDTAGQPLHDTWTFDVGTRAWHKFPAIIENVLQDQVVPGQIVYVDGRLWYLNTSTVMYLELAEHQSQPEQDDAAPPDPALFSTGRVGTGQWQVVYPPPEADEAAQAQKSDHSKEEQAQVHGSQNNVPTEPISSVVPITTGAGRVYLLTLESKDPQTMYLFQIPSTSKTAASLKDVVRDKAAEAIPTLPDSWRSGKHEWSKVEVVQSNMTEGDLDKPSQELQGFAVTAWDEYGDKFVIWGGNVEGGNAYNEGWIVSLD